MSAYILLGKNGDILSLCPILHADFIETGQKPHLIVSEKYSEIPKALDYVETVIYPGEWNDLDGAIRFAKEKFGVFYTPQMHGAGFQPKRSHPSFQLDQWARCGRLDQWGKLPMVLPRTNNPIEGFSTTGKFILFADKGESAPFEHADDLASALASQFPSHRLLRLGSLQAPHLLDVLALIDGAALLVSIDTAILHLSAASETPVIALVADKPSRWQGSSFHPRMAAHCRYGDYPIRKTELLNTAQRAVNKSGIPEIQTVVTGKPCGYNLSVLKVGDKSWTTYRWHPDATWRTEMVLVRDGVEYPIVPPAKYAKHSLEDGRLAMFHGKPHISLTVARSHLPGEKCDPCIQAFGQLGDDGKMLSWIEPQVGRNDWTTQEKNWSFFEYNGLLHVIYKHAPELLVYELNAVGKVTKEYRTKSPTCYYGEARGGTQPMPFGDGKWIRFVHCNQHNKKSDVYWNYAISAVIQEAKPPFRILQMSKHPILVGDELYYPGCKRWKPKVLICYGAIEQDGGWLVALGKNDAACVTANIRRENLNL